MEKIKKAWKDWRQFHKGDLIYTECGFPSFLYESQTAKEYISIYCFGEFDEWGSEYTEKAVRENDKERWFQACASRGYARDYVIQKAKEFKVEL